MKIIVNKCYGGFSFSEKAILLYAKIKGIAVYPDGNPVHTVYWTVPVEDRAPYLRHDAWYRGTVEARVASSLFYKNNTISKYLDYEGRTDPIWVAVVEELGEEANGTFANLKIVDIPNDVNWEIESFCGYETIREVSRTW